MKSRKNNINRPAPSRRLLLQLLTMMALTAAPSCVYAQNLGFHKKGQSGLPLDSRGMQQTAEWHYYYYLPTNSNTMELELPFDGWGKSSTNDLEPYGWIRWYDYTTDLKSDRLTVYSRSTYLKSLKDKTSEKYIGLIAGSLRNSARDYAGVKYNKPTGADAEDWAGETIACDVSRYNDYSIYTNYVEKEPTLSIRYIFHIKSAAYLAKRIKDALCDHSRAADLTLEDNKRIVFGAKDANANMTLRTNMKNSGGQSYWFYPLRTTVGKTVYPTTEAQKITAADFNTTMKQANKIVWIVYNEDKTKFCQLSSTTQFCDLTINALKNATWYNVSNDAKTSKPTDIGFEQTVYVVAWAANGDYMCPVANFEVFIHKGYPKMKDELTADGDVDRTISYFEDKYEQQMDISFDDDNPDLTLDAPTTPLNNMSLKPSDFKSRAYGFTYAELARYDYYYDGSTPHHSKSPIHGDYGLYKSGNLRGISYDNENGYQWWAAGSPTIYDRTHAKTSGKQYGHFLYVDASNESRQIASADFKANLCTGSQLIFSGAVAEYTASYNATAPQVMFRLYGINKDENGNVTDQKLIQSFSSGDFKTNTKSHEYGKWYQIYSKQVLQKSAAADNYTDFRIVLDNMCQNTKGADYCIDDLCLYTQTSKLDVLQNKPLCPNETGYETAPDDITLKLRGIYETFQAMVNQKESKLFYRICDATGKQVENIDYDGDGHPDEYGIALIPASYNAGLVLPPEAADGKTVPMFENDNSGNRCLVIANRNFNIVPGKDYYFSIAYPSDDNPDVPGKWGISTDVCSTYSGIFQVVEQNIKLTDKNSNVLTALRVNCNTHTPTVEVIAKIETADPVNGGKVTIDNVKFDWFLSKPNAENELYTTTGLLEALHAYRAKYPEYNGLSTYFRNDNRTQYDLLKKYVDSKQLILNASNSMGNRTFASDEMGLYKIAVIPVQAKATINGQVYEICAAPMLVDLRVVTDGPNINFGFPGIIYPNDARTVRVGLSQIKAIAEKNGALNLPMTGIEGAKSVNMSEEDAQVCISNTNDPDFNSTKQAIGVVTANTIYETDKTVGIRFNPNAATILKEGYWYEIHFRYNNADGSMASCPGETFIKMCIVPEYATWNSSPRTASTNWNDDNNWLRSTKAEIFKDSYADYNTTTAFMPMKFTKVTVANQNDKGKVYPNLDEISYRSNGIASSTKMKSFAYDFVAKWSNTTDDGSDTGNGTFSCEKWAGNFCDQIYFKPEAELLYANYLNYNKAYVEKELTPNTWSIMSSPLQQTYAGDLYVPKNNGQEQSEAFKPMTYKEGVNDRSAYPIYQRSWDGDAQEVKDNVTNYSANHDGTVDVTTDNELSINSGYWSHVYNKVDEQYTKGQAFAVKAGDKYTAGAQGANAKAVIRLPKADTQFSYYDSESQKQVNVTVNRDANSYRMLQGDVAGDKTMAMTQPLKENLHRDNRYHLVGNPYTSLLSMYRFLKANTAFENSIWTLDNGKVTAYTLALDDVYDKKTDVLVGPTQAFFVKLKAGASATEATFNASMLINKDVTPGEKALVIRPTLMLTTTDGVRNSESKLIVNDEACREYVEGEDVEMLGEGNIAEIAQVYSVAGSQAVALNASDDINWMPVGVVAPKSKDIDVNISLNSKMLIKMNNEGSQLFLFDATTKTFSEIKDGMTVKMMANDHGRYYITNQSSLNTTAINTIECFSPTENTIVVATLKGDMKRVVVYDISGALVTSNHSVNGGRCQLNVPKAGIYVVKATTMEDRTETFKIVVR